jgi:hypothetical protein
LSNDIRIEGIEDEYLQTEEDMKMEGKDDVYL